MASDTFEFPITIVSTDTTALRELSWTLSSFGYQVVASSDWSEHAHWRQIESPSLLLLDARDKEEIQAELSSEHSTSIVYRIAFHDAISMANPEQLMDSGADDFIHYPVNLGELLARLKSGIRRLEFERRYSMTITLDHQTGIATRNGFIRQLDRHLRAGQDTKAGALVVMGIDFLDTIYSQNGYFAAEEASTTLAQCLIDQLSGEDFFGKLQEGIFSVLLPGCTDDEGMEFAEGVARVVNEQDAPLRDKRNRLSVSGVVLNCPAEAVANDMVERGLTAFGHVKCSGGNLILNANEIEQGFSKWQQNFDDSPSSRPIFAQHVMEALPVVLPSNGLTSADKHSLGIYAFASGHSLPPCVPVVDKKGDLLGVIEPNSIQQYGSDVFHSLDEHLIPVSTTVNSKLALDELTSTMATVQEDYLVVVEDKKPIGYITSKNLADLTVDPIVKQAASLQLHAEAGLSSLVVPVSN